MLNNNAHAVIKTNLGLWRYMSASVKEIQTNILNNENINMFIV